jgi:hypothetical protein
MVDRSKVVLVECRLSRASFPTMCFFRVQSVAGEFHGVVPIEYCYTADRQRVNKELPAGQTIDGLLVGVEWKRTLEGVVQVELPDGELYDIPSELVQRVGEPSGVPVQS